MIGFMGCYAAINALKMARHIVRSEPGARVLVVNLELCTLHLQETEDFEKMLSFLLWGDGCAACLVSADRRGLELEDFCALIVPDSHDLITWQVSDSGFDMVLSGQVPGDHTGSAARQPWRNTAWQACRGDRSVGGASGRPHSSRRRRARVGTHATGPCGIAGDPRRFGNMSSATVMFVLEALLRSAARGASGCAMSFGPGLVAETMRFRAAGI